MPRGFFSGSTIAQSKAPLSLVPKCGACGLFKTCRSPKMEVDGKGKRKILIVGEAPGREEDERGQPFVGESGQLLETELRRVGINMRQDCWIYNSLICRPPKNVTPTPNQIDYCRPNVIKTIQQLQPEVIICVGKVAVHSVIGYVWKEEVGELSRWVGWNIPSQKLNAWICPTYHPAHLLRNKDKALRFWWQRHLAQATSRSGRPFTALPDYRQQIELITDDLQAATAIAAMTRRGKLTAFDYETNMLKPDWPERQVVSAAMSQHGKTIAFLWQRRAAAAAKEFLVSDVPKIASYMKMEDRWTREVLGVNVRNWYFDTTIGAHTLDNREDITGLKFQAFVLLGCEVYDDHIKRFLQSKAGKRVNQILEEIDLHDLLFYNGMDALLEDQVARIQMKALKYPMP